MSRLTIMSKVVQAINAMIANHQLIENVTKGDDEIFFAYKGKYIWSAIKRSDGVHVWYYPGNISIKDLVEQESMGLGFDGIPMVHYHDAEIGTKEAKASFSELYTLLSEKVYGIDEVLNDIISDGEI